MVFLAILPQVQGAAYNVSQYCGGFFNAVLGGCGKVWLALFGM